MNSGPPTNGFPATCAESGPAANVVDTAVITQSSAVMKFMMVEMSLKSDGHTVHSGYNSDVSPIGGFLFLADGVGFEPTKGLHPCRISSPVHSTALPPIRRCFEDQKNPVRSRNRAFAA